MASDHTNSHGTLPGVESQIKANLGLRKEQRGIHASPSRVIVKGRGEKVMQVYAPGQHKSSVGHIYGEGRQGGQGSKLIQNPVGGRRHKSTVRGASNPND